MILKSRLAGLAAGLLLSVALVQPALAAPKAKPTGAEVPYVDFPDVQRAYQKTGAFAKYQQQIRDRIKQYGDEMKVLAQLRYSTEAERAEALELQAKTNPSNKEKARLEELMGKADKIDNEIASLSQKMMPTDADTKRLKELSQLRTDAARDLAKAEADRRDQIRKLDLEIATKIENEILALVAKYAKDEKLPLIYERRAVLFGGQDLTPEVIKKLPK